MNSLVNKLNTIPLWGSCGLIKVFKICLYIVINYGVGILDESIINFNVYV